MRFQKRKARVLASKSAHLNESQEILGVAIDFHIQAVIENELQLQRRKNVLQIKISCRGSAPISLAGRANRDGARGR